MREAEIKAAILNKLRDERRISKRALLANEYVLGKSSIRADLAIIDNGRFIGIEIKSELDTLKRLRSQIAAYSTYFDDTLLVVASRHCQKLHAETISAVELWQVDSIDTITRLTSSLKPLERKDLPLISLLTMSECRKYSTLLRASLEDPVQARVAFFKAFGDRFQQSSRKFWDRVGKKTIRTEDMTILSRYREHRQNVIRQREEFSARWRNWAEQLVSG